MMQRGGAQKKKQLLSVQAPLYKVLLAACPNPREAPEEEDRYIETLSEGPHERKRSGSFLWITFFFLLISFLGHSSTHHPFSFFLYSLHHDGGSNNNKKKNQQKTMLCWQQKKFVAGAAVLFSAQFVAAAVARV
mmetsp:Transcript_11054/g.17297  ORF Transcript_11054/g.17297 Transcript_11054/m.17297 type:complete len:134 (-) Transcript_11054:73-474(-)